MSEERREHEERLQRWGRMEEAARALDAATERYRCQVEEVECQQRRLTVVREERAAAEVAYQEAMVAWRESMAAEACVGVGAA